MVYFLMCHSKTVWKSASECCLMKFQEIVSENSINFSGSCCFLKQDFNKKRKRGLKKACIGAQWLDLVSLNEQS